MSTSKMKRRRTPRVEHDGVKEMTASLRHDGQNTSEIGTVMSAPSSTRLWVDVHSVGIWDDRRSHDGDSNDNDP
jgi:hypothetical protein